MAKEAFKGAIKREHIKKYRNRFLKEPALRLAMNAVTRGNLQEIALNRDVINRNNWTFSHVVKETPDISDQKRAGTCWLFAELNWMRSMTMKKSKIEKLEFSENYLMFYDKLEKANYYLEKLMGMLDRDIDDRYVRFILDSPTPDGGEWHMIVNLINKYGLVPNDVMPGTWNQENSRFINELVGYKIREAFAHMRTMEKEGKETNDIQEYKTGILAEIYRIIATCLGIPPKVFDWSFRDKDKKYHQEIGITPKEYYQKYVGLDFDECYSLASCP
ncbi:aminopeptidase, partial [bacterium]|nr:aminopeptidase [bacterium]